MARKKKSAPVIDLEVISAEIQPEREFAEAHLRQLHEVPLDTQEQADLFGRLLVAVRTKRDDLEEKRKTIADPLNATKRALDALFRPMRDLYDAMDTTIVDRLAAWRAAGEVRQVTALAAVAQGTRDERTLAQAHGTAETPEDLVAVEEYDIEVVDEAAIPRHFLCFDRSTALAYVRSKKGNCEIAGCKVIKREAYRRRPAIGGGSD